MQSWKKGIRGADNNSFLLLFPVFFFSFLSFLSGPWRETWNTVSFGIAIEFDRSSFRFNLRASLKLRAFPTRDRRPVFTGASTPWPRFLFFLFLSLLLCHLFRFLECRWNCVLVVTRRSPTSTSNRSTDLVSFAFRWLYCPPLSSDWGNSSSRISRTLSRNHRVAFSFSKFANNPNISNYYCYYCRDICNFFYSAASFTLSQSCVSNSFNSRLNIVIISIVRWWIIARRAKYEGKLAKLSWTTNSWFLGRTRLAASLIRSLFFPPSSATKSSFFL